MITNRDHMKKWMEQLAIGRWICITQLKMVTLHQVQFQCYKIT